MVRRSRSTLSAAEVAAKAAKAAAATATGYQTAATEQRLQHTHTHTTVQHSTETWNSVHQHSQFVSEMCTQNKHMSSYSAARRKQHKRDQYKLIN